MGAIGRALIVGGGVAGMSCAIQMRKAGIEVDLIDRDPLGRIDGAGITVSGPTLRALRTVGVVDEVLAMGATWNNFEVHDQAGRHLGLVEVPPLAAGLPGTGGIMRPVLHKILSNRSTQLGTRVRLGVTLADLKDHGDCVEATLSDGSVSRFDLVVGADGIFSELRDRLFADAPQPIATGQVIYRLVAERPADFEYTHFFMGTDIKVGFNPVSTTHMYMYLLHKAAANPQIEPVEQPRMLYEAMAGFGGFVPAIRETVLTSNAHTVNYRQLEVLLQPAPWYRGRAVLIGDAAHATTLHLAYGAGMAIEDGVVLVEELGRCASLGAALEGFMARRFERCRRVIENSVELGRLEMTHGSPAVHAKLMSESLAALREPI
jgi:2-polyprenyl-6-methoxyphenol hydroxylase-like FAD-dependent oxidoreductase